MLCHLFTRLYINVEVKQLYVKQKETECVPAAHTHKQLERNCLQAQIKIYSALCVDFTAAHIIEISRWDRKKQLLSWYEIVLLQALLVFSWVGRKSTPTPQALGFEESLRAD